MTRLTGEKFDPMSYFFDPTDRTEFSELIFKKILGTFEYEETYKDSEKAFSQKKNNWGSTLVLLRSIVLTSLKNTG